MIIIVIFLMIIRRRVRLHSVPPSCSPAVVTAEVLSLFWKADGDDVWSKSDWTVQLEQSDVILIVIEAQLSIVLRMDLSSLYTPHHNVMRRTLNLLILIIDPEVDLNIAVSVHTLHTVSSGDHELFIKKRASTLFSLQRVDIYENLPWPLP